MSEKSKNNIRQILAGVSILYIAISYFDMLIQYLDVDYPSKVLGVILLPLIANYVFFPIIILLLGVANFLAKANKKVVIFIFASAIVYIIAFGWWNEVFGGYELHDLEVQPSVNSEY